MRLEELDYSLPVGLIAQRPLDRRDASRMLVLDRRMGSWEDSNFSRLPDFLKGGELLVFNNARVIPARLFGKRAGIHSQEPSRKTQRQHLTGNVEVFLTRKLEDALWEALVRPGRKMKVGERVRFGAGELEAEIVSRGELGVRGVRLTSNNNLSVEKNLEKLGHVPLPPYIARPDEARDRERYQTIFARQGGAVAAPTAGLHFTAEVLEALRKNGCEFAEVTLDVGLGTFQPIHTETFEAHKIHTETYEINEQAAEKIGRAKREGRPVLAVGTTVVRTLEDAAARARAAGREEECIAAGRAEASIYILPGHKFQVVDALLTNFHLPKSTLLALVCAFAGREQVLAAYRHAVEERYRFFSYGDCKLIR